MGTGLALARVDLVGGDEVRMPADEEGERQEHLVRVRARAMVRVRVRARVKGSGSKGTESESMKVKSFQP